MQLGVCSEGLTKHRTNKNYTKPHVFAQRLDLLRLLSNLYNKEIRPELASQEDRMSVFLDTYKGLWVSKIVPEHYFVSWTGGSEEHERLLVLGSGPDALRVLPLVIRHEDSVFSFKDMRVPREERIVSQLMDIVISETQPCLATDQLAWRQTSAWMSLPEYIAQDSILWLPRGLLSSVCSAMGMKHSNMNYKARVRAFLEHMKKDEQYINRILEDIPDVQPKTRKSQDDDP